MTGPCVASNRDATDCIVGLLLGVACCPDGNCAPCECQRERMRHSGFSEAAVRSSFARPREGLLDRCPACGFPPPVPIAGRAPLPRPDRAATAKSGSTTCPICHEPLERGRRRYCSGRCERLRSHHHPREWNESPRRRRSAHA